MSNLRRRASRVQSAALLMCGCGILAVGAFGCIEIQWLITGTRPGGGTPIDGNTNGHDNDNGGNGGGLLAPRVSLSVSNPTPIIGEEVLLTCTVIGGDAADSFTFSPAARLIVDSAAGRARFIVDPADANTAFSFTCAGRNDAGIGPPSTPRVIISTGEPSGP